MTRTSPIQRLGWLEFDRTPFLEPAEPGGGTGWIGSLGAVDAALARVRWETLPRPYGDESYLRNPDPSAPASQETPGPEARRSESGRPRPPSDASGRRATPEATDGPAHADSDAETLLRTIEGEIIPRLLLSHRSREAARRVADGSPSLEAGDRDRFLACILNSPAHVSHLLLHELLERGIDTETLLLDLLGGTARVLGEMWEEDRVDFAEVTIGLCRLHEVLRWLSARQENTYDGGVEARPDPRRVLLATACSDQHVFGVVIVAEFFRRARWQVWSEPGATRSQLSTLLASERFDLLGLSATCELAVDEVASEIRTLRKASCATELKVLVGGGLFAQRPELATEVGADATAPDAQQALDIASKIVAHPPGRG